MGRVSAPALGYAIPWIALLCLAAAVPPDRAAVEHGRDVYRVYCAQCHGPDGRGDGPAGRDLLVRPPDLTSLARESGGRFPLEAIRSAIDGRAFRQAPAGQDMPIWGLAFQESGTDADQEREVRARVDWLVEFLKSVQRPDP